jgi:hypothetical protein
MEQKRVLEMKVMLPHTTFLKTYTYQTADLGRAHENKKVDKRSRCIIIGSFGICVTNRRILFVMHWPI